LLGAKITAERLAVWNENAVREQFRTLAASGSNAPGYKLAFAIGGTGTTEAMGSVADAAGNIYLAGGFSGTITFPTNPATTFTSTGTFDVFVAKFSPTAQTLWARVAHSPSTLPAGLSIAGSLAVNADKSGNIYVGGGFVRSLNFLNAAGSTAASVTSPGPGYNIEAFLAKYDASGNLIWANGGGSGGDQDPADLDAGVNGISNIATDAAGHVFVGGTYNGSSLLGKAADDNFDAAFVASVNPATGIPYWVSVTDSDGFDGIQDLVPDQNGGVVALLWSDGSVITFPTVPQPTDVNFDPDYVDSFIARYDSAGNCLWVRQPGDGDYIGAQGLAVAPQGDLFVTGNAGGSVTFDSVSLTLGGADSVDTFLTRYSSSGSVIWSKALTSSGYSGANRVAVDSAGFSYLLGEYQGGLTMTGNFNSTGYVLPSATTDSLFLAQYDFAGTPRWVRPLASPTAAAARVNATANIQVDSARVFSNPATGSVVLSGDFAGQLVLDTNVSVTTNSNGQGSYAAVIPSGDTFTAPGDPALRASINSRGFIGSNYYVDIAVSDEGTGSALSTQITSAKISGLAGANIVSTAIPAALGTIPPTGTRIQRILISGVSTSAASRFILAVNAQAQNASGKIFTAAYSAAVITNPAQ
jgi:hypothetical protein